MSNEIVVAGMDSTVVELVPDESDERQWTLLADLAEYLWMYFGLQLDCDRVIVVLAYGGAEERPEDAPEGAAAEAD